MRRIAVLTLLVAGVARPEFSAAQDFCHVAHTLGLVHSQANSFTPGLWVEGSLAPCGFGRWPTESREAQSLWLNSVFGAGFGFPVQRGPDGVSTVPDPANNNRGPRDEIAPLTGRLPDSVARALGLPVPYTLTLTDTVLAQYLYQFRLYVEGLILADEHAHLGPPPPPPPGTPPLPAAPPPPEPVGATEPLISHLTAVARAFSGGAAGPAAPEAVPAVEVKAWVLAVIDSQVAMAPVRAAISAMPAETIRAVYLGLVRLKRGLEP